MALSRSRAAVGTILRLVGDIVRLVSEATRSHAQLAAENLFLRKTSLYLERQGEAMACRRRDADRARRSVVSDRVASRPHRREAGHVETDDSQDAGAVTASECVLRTRWSS
jgi:hypothetical protein